MTLNRIIETGSYTGNSSTQSISIGWQPAVVWIGSQQTTAPDSQQAFSIKTDTIAGDDFQSYDTDAQFITVNGITLTSDGFDVGSSPQINNSTQIYKWIAFRVGPQVDTGTYTGDGIGGRKITSGRQAALLMILQTSGTDSISFKL